MKKTSIWFFSLPKRSGTAAQKPLKRLFSWNLSTYYIQWAEILALEPQFFPDFQSGHQYWIGAKFQFWICHFSSEYINSLEFLWGKTLRDSIKNRQKWAQSVSDLLGSIQRSFICQNCWNCSENKKGQLKSEKSVMQLLCKAIRKPCELICPKHSVFRIPHICVQHPKSPAYQQIACSKWPTHIYFLGKHKIVIWTHHTADPSDILAICTNFATEIAQHGLFWHSAPGI